MSTAADRLGCADIDRAASDEQAKLSPVSDDGGNRVLRGRVVSGIGGHAHWMTVYADLYEAKTGAKLYPGSLNVVLDSPWYVPANGIRLEPPEYGIGMSIVRCRIEGVDAFILRTDKNDVGDGDHPATVIEIAASIRLRDVLNLEDGSEVEVNLGPDLAR